MVSVTLSPEVRPLPMPSIEDHIQQLKAAARNVEAKPGQLQDNTKGRSTPYLPPPEVAKDIPCRFYPSCKYAGRCIFYHPPAAENHSLPSITSFETSVSKEEPTGELESESNSTGAGHSGNLASTPSPQAGYTNGHAGPNNYDSNAYSQMAQQVYGYPVSVAEAHSTGNENEDYMQYDQSAAAAYAAQFQQYYGYPIQPVPAYGAASPNGTALTSPYQPFSLPYYPYPSQGVYTSIPSSSYLARDPSYTQQSQTRAYNTVDSSVINDPAIISQTTQHTSPTQKTFTGESGNPSPRSNAASPKLEKPSSSNINRTANNFQVTSNNIKSDTVDQLPSNHSVHSPTLRQTDASPPVFQSPSFPIPGKNAMNSSATSPPSPHYDHSTMLQHQAPSTQYVPYVPMVMPFPEHQQNQYTYASHNDAVARAQAQAQLEIDFAQASTNGHKRSHTLPSSMQAKAPNGKIASSASATAADEQQLQSPALPHHERGSFHQMHTFFQTGISADGNTAAASIYNPATSSADLTGSPSLSSSTSRFPPNGARMDTFPRGRGELASSVNGPGGHLKRSSYGGPSSSSRGPYNGSPRNPLRAYDPSRPIPCSFFRNGECRNGDICHFIHHLDQERAIPGSEGKMTRDAKLLKMNIGNPKGEIATSVPRPVRSEFANSRHPRSHTHPRLSQSHNHAFNHNNELGIEKLEALDRPMTAGKVDVNVKEKFERLLSETPRLSNNEVRTSPAIPSGPSLPTSGLDSQEQASLQPPQDIAIRAHLPPPSYPRNGSSPIYSRNSSIPPTLGRRPPQNKSKFAPLQSQRVPNGESDFPALIGAPAISSGMERPGSSSSNNKEPSVEESSMKAVSAPIAGVEAVGISNDTANTIAQPNMVPPASASKASFSWAFAAAKAASLPDPPARIASSKPRPAPVNAARSSENLNGAGDAPAIMAAAQVLNAESSSAPAVKV